MHNDAYFGSGLTSALHGMVCIKMYKQFNLIDPGRSKEEAVTEWCPVIRPT